MNDKKKFLWADNKPQWVSEINRQAAGIIFLTEGIASFSGETYIEYINPSDVRSVSHLNFPDYLSIGKTDICIVCTLWNGKNYVSTLEAASYIQQHKYDMEEEMELYAVMKKNDKGIVVESGNGLLNRKDNIITLSVGAEKVAEAKVMPEYGSGRFVGLTYYYYTDKYSGIVRETRYFEVPKRIYEAAQKQVQTPFKVDVSWIKGRAREVLMERVVKRLNDMNIIDRMVLCNMDYYAFKPSTHEAWVGIKLHKKFDNMNAREVSVNDILESNSLSEIEARAARRESNKR